MYLPLSRLHAPACAAQIVRDAGVETAVGTSKIYTIQFVRREGERFPVLRSVTRGAPRLMMIKEWATRRDYLTVVWKRSSPRPENRG